MNYFYEVFSGKKAETDVFLERVKMIRAVARREVVERLEMTSALRSKAEALLLKMEEEDNETFNNI